MGTLSDYETQEVAKSGTKPTEEERAAYEKRCKEEHAACLADPKAMLDWMNKWNSDSYITLEEAKNLMRADDRCEYFDENVALFGPHKCAAKDRAYHESFNRPAQDGKIPSYAMVRLHPKDGKPVYLRVGTYLDYPDVYVFIRKKEVSEWLNEQRSFLLNARS